MTIIRRPSPFTEFVSLRDAMERLFDEQLFRPLWTADSERELVPALDLYTTPESVIAKVALPGVKAEDVDVVIADDVVTVKGSFKEAKETTEAGYIHKELSRGSFSRSFSLPTTVKAEAATATFADGVLTLGLPKIEEAKPTHVKVEVSS
jgi:HSP20 family protein